VCYNFGHEAKPVRLLISAVLALRLWGVAVGQANPVGSVGQEVMPGVTLPFIVVEGHDNPVGGVTPSDLSILDDKKSPQRLVALHTAKEMPLRLGLLIDTSNSQGSSKFYAPGVKAASAFLNQALNSPDDKAFIVSFAGTPETETDFMSRDELAKLKVNLRTGGGTALYDAVNLAAERMRANSTQPARRALVVLSDGDDNQSHVTQIAVIAAVQDARTVIFTVSTGQQPLGDKVLERFASETGGYTYSPFDAKDMPKIFANIQAKIEQMYSVTYLPAEAGKPGDFHPIELKITSRKKWKVYAPKGYYVPPSVQ
jgi:Ca-activated chloride channel homolog